ncbi:MAG: hypothetical protein WDZ94_01915 [Patescibacteria group bacterium]
MNKNFTKAFSQTKIQPQEIEGVELVISKQDMGEIETLLENEINNIFHLEKVHFNLNIDKDDNLHITPVEKKSASLGVNVAYLLLMKVGRKKYFVISSDFFLSKNFNREPYLESLQEYQYQSLLAKIFNISSLQAYNTDTLMTEQEIMDSETEMLYCEGESFSFTLYCV